MTIATIETYQQWSGLYGLALGRTILISKPYLASPRSVPSPSLPDSECGAMEGPKDVSTSSSSSSSNDIE